MKYLGKWVILTVLMVWGMLSVILLLGEEDPYNPMPLLQFIALKAGSVISLFLCAAVTMACADSGLLPKVPEE